MRRDKNAQIEVKGATARRKTDYVVLTIFPWKLPSPTCCCPRYDLYQRNSHTTPTCSMAARVFTILLAVVAAALFFAPTASAAFNETCSGELVVRLIFNGGYTAPHKVS
jgi:hypothetical protein